jgi:hypothetical protein
LFSLFSSIWIPGAARGENKTPKMPARPRHAPLAPPLPPCLPVRPALSGIGRGGGVCRCAAPWLGYAQPEAPKKAPPSAEDRG